MSASPLRIAQVCLEYVPQFGGSARTVRDVRQACGGEVIAFTSPGSEPHAPGWDDDVCRVPLSPGFLGRQYSWPGSTEELRRAERLLEGSDLAVIHLLYRYHSRWAGAIAARRRIPYWVIANGGLDPYVFTYRSGRKRLWMLAVGRRVLRGAAAVIFASEREREKALPFTRGCRTHVIHWPVDRTDDSGRPAARGRVRLQLGIPEDARMLFWIGRLDPMKRPLETIEAFRRISGPSAHLVMVGPDGGLTRQDCERFCVERKVRNVHLVSPVYGAEKDRYFMAADAYISLSHRENFNYTAAEAMASGLPLILSPGNDLAAELRGLDCGWMLDTLDDGECAGVLERFLSLPRQELERLGANGRRWAGENLSREAFSRSLHRLAGHDAD